MAWYATGTVAVTNGSNVVTGTGTQFITNIKSGDIFIALDNGLLYEVDQIVSATQLTLKREYAGVTNASAVYEIVPTTSNLKTLAQQVTDLIAIYQEIPQSATDAQDAAAAAQGYRDTAKTYQDNAAASASTASGAATTAQGYRDTAKTYQDNAAASASAAATSKSGADTAKSGADSAKAAADASAALAGNWAAQASGTVDGANYSAKYYAMQAAASAASIALPVPITSGGTGATTAAAARTALGVPAIASSNTFSASQTISYSQPLFSINDTSGTGVAVLQFNSNGSMVWQLQKTSASDLNVRRYVSGAFVDVPLSVSNSTGVATLAQRPMFGTATPWDSANLPSVSGRLLNIQVFTSSGTYTPTAGTTKVIVKSVGGGGAGGSTAATSAGQSAVGAGGSSAGYAEVLLTAGFSGVTVTVGAGGTPGAAGANSGNAGGTTSFGTIISCPGGSGGAGGNPSAAAAVNPSAGVVAPTISSGTIINALAGQPAPNALVLVPGSVAISGYGGSGPLGVGGQGRQTTGAGIVGAGYGVGGAGATTSASGAAQIGGAGRQGVLIVYEFA
ncbi:hypothetical protein QCE62_00270 [Caballeronia sp. LZ033]|uniref:glycine-rich domain-containing protein n=1 Tax=Caballeronia sp. LZ033 TaxID=3038566 RepID=UPI0028651567|nr:hypothetical protein [Caballeronia sp. LZ033]MDR5812022.1 hypothetical protein [Caballeronia sp. LZ033]